MRIVAIIIGLLLTVIIFSQKAPVTQFIRTDTLNGADTIVFTTSRLKIPSGFVGLEASCTQINGSSTNDYMVAQASQSGNANAFATLTTVDNNVYAAQNDTLSIIDGRVGLWGISLLPFDYFQVKAFGVAGDTTIISVYYVAKRY